MSAEKRIHGGSRVVRRAGSAQNGPAVVVFALLLMLAALTPIATWSTTLTSIQFATDTPTLFSSVLVSPNEAATDGLSGVVAPVSLGFLPAGASVTGFEVDGVQHRMLFSLDAPAVLGGTLFTPRDVIGYSSGAYNLVFDGAAAGVPAGTAIAGISLDLKGDLLLAFDTPATVGGIAYDPRDVVLWDGSTFSIAFDGVAAGLEPGLHIDGVHSLVNGDLLLSFDGNGSIGGIEFFDDDVLALDPSGPTWSKVYDGQTQHPGWVAANLAALSAEPHPGLTTIPALSGWGLALLVLLLAVPGWILVRRRDDAVLAPRGQLP